jgi:hypothetical protein
MAAVLRGPNAPCANQTMEAIEEWIRAHVRVGTEVVIRYAVGGRLFYQRGRVAHLDPFRVGVAVRRRDGTYGPPRGGFFYTGKNCWNPTSLSHLVIPTSAVLAACAACEESDKALAEPSASGPIRNHSRASRGR